MKSVIVLDIGTQFVKGLILETAKNNGKGIIKAWTKEPDSENTILACQKAIKNLKKKSGIKSEEVFLGIGSNFLKGKTTVLCCKRETPNQKIDLAELKYLIQKIEWRALDAVRKEFAKETEFKDIDARLLNAFIIDTRIDGRSVPDPIGSQGQNICLSVYNVYTSLEWLAEIEKLVEGMHLNLVGLVPISYALFRCLKLEKSSKGNALIIDVGSKITEMTLIKNGGETIETKSFHLGGQAFSRVLAEFLGLKLEQAELAKFKYSKGEVSLEAKRKLDKLFMPNISSWLNGIKVVLKDFFEEYKFLPSKIFLCGEGSKIPLIESHLKKEKGFKVVKFEETPCSALKKLYDDLANEKDVFSPIFKRIIKLVQTQ